MNDAMITNCNYVVLDLTIPTLFSVKGQTALVTGGTYIHIAVQLFAEGFDRNVGGSGIGLMIATALVQNGAKVYIASRKEKQLKTVRALPVPDNPKLTFFGGT